MTPLHGAAMIGNIDVARILVDKGKADVNSQTIDGYTPLHIAAISGKAQFVQFLLDKRANRDLRDKRNLTPAEEAIQSPAMASSKEGKRAVDAGEPLAGAGHWRFLFPGDALYPFLALVPPGIRPAACARSVLPVGDLRRLSGE